MNKILINTTAFPNVAKKYLSVILENNEELYDFYKNYFSCNSNIMVAIAEYRLKKLERRILPFEKFIKLYELNPQQAITELFLFPINEALYKRYIVHSIKNNLFTLNEFYDLHIQYPIYSPILIARKLLAKV